MKSLETFEFRAIPSVNKSLVLELARSEYLDRRENVWALGNSGTGKTHLALALGLAACQKGARVRFTTAAALVNELLEARDDVTGYRVTPSIPNIFNLYNVPESGITSMCRIGLTRPETANAKLNGCGASLTGRRPNVSDWSANAINCGARTSG